MSRGMYWAGWWICWFFSRVLLRLRVEGVEGYPLVGSYIMAPTHRSVLDIPAAGSTNRRVLRFMGKSELFKSRFSNWLFKSLGGFIVKRGKSDRHAIKQARDLLKAGYVVVIFPEGTRKTGDTIAKLHTGTVFIASLVGVPIVPVGVFGTETRISGWKKGHPGGRPAVVVGEPLYVARRNASKAELADELAELQSRMQAAYDEAKALSQGADG